ncbi:twin-arginine translocation signal domain-containing protein [Yersinia pseudotuberculosis]|nr:twin-arginine translocation signal domain-containing protein [Yersinia pseudotuberculosis]
MSLTRRNLLKGIAVSGALGATAAATGVLSTAQAAVPAKKTGKQPNLLIIFPDEMRT